MGRSADVERHSGVTDGDDAGCPILHVDMDAFFASVEIRRRPELRGRPVVVGGGNRGVVAAASYEARRYGIRSAMAMSMALRACPQLVVLPVDRAEYVAASRAVMAILREVTPLVEPLSLDEAFLDVTAARRRLGRSADIARGIRQRVRADLGLTCSIGIAPTKFVAKIASARCKPDGLLVVPAAEVLAFLHPLPITALWGVGPSAAQRLTRLGLRTVGEVAGTAPSVLRRALGPAAATHLSALAQGIDGRAVSPHQEEKSISSETTFDVDLTATADVNRELLRLGDEVTHRLRQRGLVARTVGIKVRFADFRTITRARTMPDSVDSTDEFDAVARALYAALELDQPRIRLLGVRAEALTPAATATRQLTLDALLDQESAGNPAAPLPSAGVPEIRGMPTAAAAELITVTAPPARTVDIDSRATLNRVSDAARSRFGSDAIRPATLVRPSADDG
jgi:DNA polymerase-4